MAKAKKVESEKKARHRCRDCRKMFVEPDIIYGPDPFASEIHDDETPVWLCLDCRHERLMDT